MERFKRNLVVVLAVSFLFAGNVNANPAGSGNNTPAIVADAFICRPMGIIALVAGSAIYVLSLPFTSMADGKEEAKRTLVLYPYHYTFTRQLGEFHDDDL
jgi:hypothetical protein